MKSAFTMIELIFVIVILGILASIAVPKLGAVKTKAEATKAQTAFVTVVKDVANGYLMAGNALNKAAISDYSNTDPEIKINGKKCGEFKILPATALSGTCVPSGGSANGPCRLVFTVVAKKDLSDECAAFLKDEEKSDAKSKWMYSFKAPNNVKVGEKEVADGSGTKKEAVMSDVYFSEAGASFKINLNDLTASKVSK